MRPPPLRPGLRFATARRRTQSIRIRTFTSSPLRNAKNRIFDPVRTPADLQTLLLLHTSRRAPLLTLWSTSWCRSCAEVSPIIQSLIRDEYVGLEQGGVGFVEVQLDAPEIGDLGTTYMIKSVPTLMAFSRGESQTETKLARLEELRDRRFLTEWIEREAARGGAGGAGGKLFGGWFG